MPTDVAYRPYVERFLLAFAVNPGIRNVLFVGCGPCVGPKMFHKSSLLDIDVIEVDSVLNEVAVEYYGLVEDDRLRLHSGDGRVFVKDDPRVYDLVVVDVLTSTDFTIPYHLATSEFLKEVKEKLGSDGVVALNLVSSLEGKASRMFRSEYKTYSLAFSSVYVFPTNPGEPEKVQNIIMIASNIEHLDLDRLRENIALIPRELKNDRLGLYADKIYEENVKLDDVPTLSDNYAPVDTLSLAAINMMVL